jgi:hypothetical protein
VAQALRARREEGCRNIEGFVLQEHWQDWENLHKGYPRGHQRMLLQETSRQLYLLVTLQKVWKAMAQPEANIETSKHCPCHLQLQLEGGC